MYIFYFGELSNHFWRWENADISVDSGIIRFLSVLTQTDCWHDRAVLLVPPGSKTQTTCLCLLPANHQ